MAWTKFSERIIVSYIDQTDVYITGVLYEQNAYPDNPNIVFDILDSAFRNIQGLYYENFGVNRSECRFSNSDTREQLLVFLKNVIVNGNKFLTDMQSTSLRSSLISALNSVIDISFTDVEIRTTREES
jgi:hypothetical protein